MIQRRNYIYNDILSFFEGSIFQTSSSFRCLKDGKGDVAFLPVTNLEQIGKHNFIEINYIRSLAIILIVSRIIFQTTRRSAQVNEKIIYCCARTAVRRP